MQVFRRILPSPRGVPPPPPPPLPLPFPLPSLILPKCPLSQRERALSKIREGRGKGSGFVIATELCIMEFPRVFQTSRAHSRAPVFHSHICQKPCLHVLFRLFRGACPFQSSRLSFSHFLAEPRAWGEALSSGKVVHIPEFQAFILIFPELQAFICTGPVQGPLTRDCPCIDARGGRDCQSTGVVKGHPHTELSMHRDP